MGFWYSNELVFENKESADLFEKKIIESIDNKKAEKEGRGFSIENLLNGKTQTEKQEDQAYWFDISRRGNCLITFSTKGSNDITKALIAIRNEFGKIEQCMSEPEDAWISLWDESEYQERLKSKDQSKGIK